MRILASDMLTLHRPSRCARPRTTWEPALLKVGGVQISVDHLGGDDVGVDKTYERRPSASRPPAGEQR